MIGGSIGLALGRTPGVRRVGIDRDEAALAKAVAAGAVDAATTDVADGVRDADIVVLAVPVRAMADVVRAAASALKPNCIVTDVGSTKVQLTRIIPPLLPPSVSYVGGHPMAGSEQAGIDAADPYLFENAVYVLTPAQDDEDALHRMLAFVRALGARPVVMSADRHDRIVAAVSHLPHLAAAALVHAAAGAAEADEHVFTLAAGGFRDTTRIASGDPALWRDICMTNREPIIAMLRRFEQTLARLRAVIETGDGDALRRELAFARAVRERLPRHRKGILSPVYELVVQLADRPGAVGEVAGRLAAKNINIKDIEILRVREGEGGTLCIGLASEADAALALKALHDAGFRARRRG